MTERWSRSIACEDNADRPRALEVVLDDRHRVVIVPPPGGAAYLQPSNIQEFKQALTDAQVECIHRRKTW